MKKKNYIYPLAAMIMFLASCTDDNNDPGTTNPNTDDRSKFVGSWTCAESTGQTFTITISLKGSQDSISIDNFANYGSSADARALIVDRSMTIPGQNISLSQIFVQGTGVMNSANTKITMNYIADSDTISATCTKN